MPAEKKVALDKFVGPLKKIAIDCQVKITGFGNTSFVIKSDHLIVDTWRHENMRCEMPNRFHNSNYIDRASYSSVMIMLVNRVDTFLESNLASNNRRRLSNFAEM